MMRTYRHPEQKPVLTVVEWIEGSRYGTFRVTCRDPSTWLGMTFQ